MTNKQQSKVRFVRCPKCTKILPEPEHIPVYACGGCGAILQAKNYKGPQIYTALSSHEQDVLKKNGINHACYAGESSSSSRRSSSDHSSAQEGGRSSIGVDISRNSEQNGAASLLDNSSLSKESSYYKNKEKVETNDIKSHKIYSKPEQNGAVYSSEVTSLSKNHENGEIDDNKSVHNGSSNHAYRTTLSGFIESKENGDRDRQIEQFDDLEDRDVNDNPTSLANEPGKLTGGNSAMKDDKGEDEECNGIVIEKLYQKHIGGLNVDRERFTCEDSIEEDDVDELEEKLVRPVKSIKDASSLPEYAAVKKNPAEEHAFDNEPERTWKMHIEGKHTYDNRREQNQMGNLLSEKNASSRTVSPGFEKPTHFVSEKHAANDASDHQRSEDNIILNNVEKHSHQDVLRNENNPHELDEREVAKPGKEYDNGTAPKDDASSLAESLELAQLETEIPRKHFAIEKQDTSRKDLNHLDADEAEAQKSSKENGNETGPYVIAEQLESVQISSTSSLSTFAQGGKDEAVSVYTPSSVTDSKTFYEMGPTKVSEARLLKNSFDNVKGMLKQNTGNVDESVVYRDRKVGREFSSKRSPAYDGSVSSFDGNDDKVADQLPQVGEETLSSNNAIAGSAGAEESPEWDSLPSERVIFGNVRPSRQARCSSSMVMDEKFKSRMIEEEGPPEQNGIHRRYRPNRDNFLPRGPIRRRSSEITYETGTTSSHALHDEPPRHQMHPHHSYGRRFHDSFHWRGNNFLPVYNSEASGELYDRPKHHSYMDRRRRTESWSQSGTLPRNPYSGEMFSGRYPYMQRFPEDRRWSAQLPPPGIYFHPGSYMNHGWETRWDPYDPYPTSPQQFMESEASCAWAPDAMSLSKDPRHKDQIMRQMYLREKRQAMKTPFHPIAGGTPFISCDFCFNILQLPQDFLRSRRRTQRRNHKLRCGACSRVLEFSLENEGGLTPSETNLNRFVNTTISSHSHVNHSRNSSVSSADSRILLSRDSFGASNRAKRMSRSGSSSKEEQMEGLHDDDNDDDAPPRGRPSKVTWKVPDRSKSPLHKLMGYSSPKEMLAYPEVDDIE